MSFQQETIAERNALNDIAERKRMLERAKIAAPETESIYTDGHGNWYGVRGRGALPIPTTNIVGPDGDDEFERFED